MRRNTLGQMSFFDPIDITAIAKEPEMGEKWTLPEWWGPPYYVVGGVVPFRTVLHQGQQLAIAVDRVLIYPTGLILDLELYLPVRSFEGLDVSGYFPWALIEANDDPRRIPPRTPPTDAADYFRLGIRYADGRTVATTTWDEFSARERTQHPPAETELALAGGHGRGHHGRKFKTVWVSPAPTDGPVELHVEWPACRVPELSVSIPSDAIQHGRSQISTLWPQHAHIKSAADFDPA